MKYFFLIFTAFLSVNTVKASAIEQVDGDADPAPASWKTNPCLVMLAGEIAKKHNVSFQFRNGVSLLSTAEDPLCDDERHKKDGISWRCRYENSWSSDIGRNVACYADKCYGISYRDLRVFFLAEEAVKVDGDMWALWQILFAGPEEPEEPEKSRES